MKVGDKGISVSSLQTALVRVLGPICAIDGDFGPKTLAAVNVFAAARQLPAMPAGGNVPSSVLAALVMSAAPASSVPVAASNAPAAPDAGLGSFDASGRLSGARQCPANPARIGAAIKPWSIVAHTTDTFRGGMAAIMRSWSTTVDQGQAAHFMIGRGPATNPDEQWPSDGLVQMVPIFHNGNHAGGSHKVNGQWVQWHGNFVVDGALVHPNGVTVGIEVDNAGRLSRNHGAWIHTDSYKPIDDANVYVDSDGHGWEKFTPWQLKTLGDLIELIDDALEPVPANASIKPNGDWKANGSAWAQVKGVRLVAHATLDPNNKTDCGPEALAYLRTRFDI